MNKQTVAIVSIALLSLLGAFAVPTMMNATNDPQTFDTRLEVGMTEQVTDGLTITVNDSSNTETSVQLTDTETDQEALLVIPEGATESYSLPGGSGNVTAVETGNQAATLEVEYDPMYGWSSPAQTIVDNIGIILTLMLFVIVMGGVKVVIG